MHKQLLELIRDFSKFLGHKIDVQKSIVFLYTSNEQSEKEIGKTMPFIRALKIKL